MSSFGLTTLRLLCVISATGLLGYETESLPVVEAPGVAAIVYESGTRWLVTATNGGTTGSDGQGVTLTWGFIPDGTCISSNGLGPSELHAVFDAQFGSTAAWESVFSDAFSAWAGVCGVSFVREQDDDGIGGGVCPQSFASRLFGPSGDLGVRADIRIGAKALTNSPALRAFGNGPDDGDILFNTVNLTNWVDQINGGPSDYFRTLVAHEIGHALGLLHSCPIDRTKLMEENPSPLFPFLAPQLDDIRGIQRFYGDASEGLGGNDTASDATSLGSLGSVPTTLGDRGLRTSNDEDWYSFSLAVCSTLALTVTRTGHSYATDSGCTGTPPGGGWPSIPAHAIMEHHLEVFDATGSIVLGANTTNGPVKTLSLSLAPGLYSIRISSPGPFNPSLDDVQLYDLAYAAAPVLPLPIPPTVQLLAPLPVCLGQQATFTTVVSQTSQPLSYQWEKDGVPIPGATLSSLNIPSVSSGDLGSYGVRVSIPCASTLSSPGELVLAGVQLSLTQAAAGAPFVVANSCGADGEEYFTALSIDANNATSAGWWFGLQISFIEVANQFQTMHPLFHWSLDAVGSSSFALPLPPGLTGQQVWGVTVTFDPAQPGVNDVSQVATWTLL